MATLEKKGKSYRVRVSVGSKSRAPITIGPIGRQMAGEVRGHIAELEASLASGVEPRSQTRGWLLDIGDDLHGRLAAAGLVKARASATPVAAKTVGDAIDKFYETSNTVPQTVLAYRQGTEQLVNHFTRLRALDTIGAAEADELVAAIRKSGLARATQSKRLQIIKRLFGRCVRWGWIRVSPFNEVRPGHQSNPERLRYISADYVEKIIAVVKDPEWKAILALARFGGLRCPSEIVGLKWEHVDFERGRIRVPSPKTAKAGKPFRIIPLFAELRPYLEALDRGDGTGHLITRYRQSNANLRTQLDRWVLQAGLKPVPKPFQNMRASRATEIQKNYGAKAATDWLGHTEGVAMLHYWQTTDDDFTRAAREGAAPTTAGWQKGWQTPAVAEGPERTPKTSIPEISLEYANSAGNMPDPNGDKWALQDSNL